MGPDPLAEDEAALALIRLLVYPERKYIRYVHTGDLNMHTTRVFQNGNSQALRIPQELRTEEKEFYINKIGEIFIAYPADDPWATVRQVIGTFPEDFMEEREQPPWEDIPEREGF